MTRFGSLAFCAILGCGLFACGSNGTSNPGSGTKNPADLAPSDNAVTGWRVDTAANKNGNAEPMTATSMEQAVGLIDGAAAPFYKDPYTPKGFVWQNYVNTSLPAAPPPQGAGLILYVWEMPTAEQASGLYAALLQESEYSGNWQSTSTPLGAESRIEDTNTAWWINFHKDVFYIEVMLSPSYGPAPDYTIHDPDLEAETLRFAQAVASKI
jgi:hypothetical protein